MRKSRLIWPQAAFDWLTRDCQGPVLSASASLAVPRALAARGLEVFAINRDANRAAKLRTNPQITTVVARAEALPFVTCHFGMIHAHQIFQQLAPGLALPELARVLRGHGFLAASYFSRDETVPWVRRLVELMRSVEMMQANAEADAIAPLLTSKYFPKSESKTFRVWTQIDRQSMLELVAREAALSEAKDIDLHELLRQAGTIFDSATSGLELRLPYQLTCYRLFVDHNEFTTPIKLNDDALVFSF
jgi:SAM-dependent methyltransferase